MTWPRRVVPGFQKRPWVGSVYIKDIKAIAHEVASRQDPTYTRQFE